MGTFLASSRADDLIAGFDFDEGAVDSFTYDPFFNYTLRFPGYYTDAGNGDPINYDLPEVSNFTPRAVIVADGTKGSSSWNGNSSPDENSIYHSANADTTGSTISTAARSGSGINASSNFGVPVSQGPFYWLNTEPGVADNFGSAWTGNSMCLAFVPSRQASGNRFTIQANTSGFDGIELEWAGWLTDPQSTGNALAGTIHWFICVDGITVVDTNLVTSLAGSTPTVYTVNFEAFTGLNRKSEVWIIGELDAPANIDIRFDYLQVLATGVATVTPVAPTLTGTPANAVLGQPYSFTFTTSGTPAPTLSLSGAVPAGIVFNAGAGTLSGTPTTSGAFPITITADNDVEPNATLDTTLVVQAPTSLSGTPPDAPAGQPYAFTFTIEGYPAPAAPLTLTGDLPTGLTFNGTTGALSGTPTETGAFSIEISGGNGIGTNATHTATVTVTAPPTLSGSPPPGRVGFPYGYTFSVGGFPAPTLTITSGALPSGLALSGTQITGTPTASGTTADITIRAENAIGSAVHLTFSLTINQSPVLGGTPAAATINVPYTFNAQPAGFPAAFTVAVESGALPPGLALEPTTGVVSGTPTQTGTYSFSLSVSNGVPPTQVVAYAITVQGAPVITSPLQATAVDGAFYTYAVAADNSPSSFSATGLPSGLTINASSGVISGTPTTTGTFLVTIAASNAIGSDERTLELQVLPGGAAIITSESTAEAILDQPFSFAVTATNSPTAFAATGLPPGLAIDGTTGVISGEPTTSGTFDVALNVTNAVGISLGTLRIRVIGTPAITSATSARAVRGVAFSYQIVATDSPVSYQVEGLPAGLSINPATGLISGTPSASGDFSVTLTATNAAGTGTDTLALDVLGPPTITSAATATAEIDVPFSFTITTSDAADSITAVGLPGGLVLDSATGQITGTAQTVAVASVQITAVNAAGTATDALELRVVARPRITSAPAAVGYVGVPFEFQVTASRLPDTFAATSLPPGLSIDSATGLITGVPTASGVFTVNLTATNGAGSGAGGLTLTIRGVPVITNAAAVPIGGVDTPFTFQIEATDLPTSYAADGLPEGLSIDAATGLVSGTPGIADTYTVTLRAANAAGEGSAEASFEIVGLPEITSSLEAGGPMGAGFTYTITASGRPTSFAATGLPSGLSINESTGIISGTTTEAGTFPIALKVTNVAGSTTGELVLTFAMPPVINGPFVAFGVEGQPLLVELLTDNVPTSFDPVTPPAGLSWDTASGVLSGTPVAAGDVTLHVVARNVGGSDESTLRVYIFSRAEVLRKFCLGLLGREPTAAELAAAQSSKSLGELGAEIYRSAAFTALGHDLVTGLYRGLTASATTAARYPTVVEFTKVTTAAGAMRDRLLTAANEFLASDEFKAFGRNYSNAFFAQYVYLGMLGRYPSISEMRSLESQLADGRTTRAAVVVDTLLLPEAATTRAKVSDLAAQTAALSLLDRQLTAEESSDLVAFFEGASLEVMAAEMAALPVFTSAPTATLVVGQAGVYTLTAVGEPQPTFGMVGAPAWLSLGVTSGVLTGTPPSDAPAEITFVVEAANGVAPKATQQMRLSLLRPKGTTEPSSSPLGDGGEAASGSPVFADSSFSFIRAGEAGSAPWLAFGKPEVVPSFAGRDRVLDLNRDGADFGQLVSAASLPGTSQLRTSVDVRLDVASTGATGAHASLAMTANPQSLPATDGSEGDTGNGVRFAIGLVPDADDPTSQGLYALMSYLAEDGSTEVFDYRNALRRDELAGEWVRLEFEITADRSIAFWLDAEPLGEPVRIWAPAEKAHPSLLAGQRIVLQGARAASGVSTYLDDVRVAGSFTPRAASTAFVNMSSRAYAGDNEQVAIAGLVTDGLPLDLLIRGIGPALHDFGLTDFLQRPQITLYDVQARVLRVQKEWEDSSGAGTTGSMLRSKSAALGAYPLRTGSADSAYFYEFPATGDGSGSLRTVHLAGADGGTGEGLIEFYRDTTASKPGRMINLSTRAFVPAQKTLIAGWVISGNSARWVLIRAVGPGLSKRGVQKPLTSPAIALYRGSELVRTNAGWHTAFNASAIRARSAEIGAFDLAEGGADSAILVRLDPGSYTAVITSVSDTDEGVVLAEIYDAGEN